MTLITFRTLIKSHICNVCTVATRPRTHSLVHAVGPPPPRCCSAAEDVTSLHSILLSLSHDPQLPLSRSGGPVLGLHRTETNSTRTPNYRFD